MPIPILMPALSPTMTEGNLAKWHKKPGDKVKPGQVIAEIETDKATMEVEAVDEGVIGKILVDAGTQNVKVNSAIAVLLEDGETEAALKDFVVTSPSPQPSPVKGEGAPGAASPRAGEVAAKAAGEGAKASPTVALPTNVGSLDRLKASPLARRVAQQKDVDLRGVAGSGPNGRIVKADVENAQPGAVSMGGPGGLIKSKALAPNAADVYGQKYHALANSQIRKIIAKRLLEAKQTIPHFYLTVDCHIDALLDMRKVLNEHTGAKVSVNDFVIRAVACALGQVPAANATWSEDAILQYAAADISVAVATDNGLVTPIVRDALNKSLHQISDQMKDLAERARANKLRPEEFQGGGFTISNLGMYGVKQFSAIINPPQSCILAVGAGEKRAVVADDGSIKAATVMTVTLSVDHRSVDGSVGAEFLKSFKNFIEHPVLLAV